MTQNILIDFSSDTTGITTAAEAVQQLAGVDMDLADSFNKTNITLKERDKVQQKVKGSLDQIAEEMKKVEKAAVGAFGTKVIEDLRKKLDATNTTAKGLGKTLSGDLAANVQKGLAAAGITAEQFSGYLKEAGISAEEFYKLFADGADKSKTKTLTLRQQLAAMRNELATLDEGSPEFEALLKKAGELDDKIKDLRSSIANTGSDTRNIQGVVELTGAVAGGFAIAQGAAALFGSENEELQQTLLKVNAAMSILQGIEQIENVIQKETAASQLLTRIFFQQKTAAIVENTVATEANVAATEEVVVAEGEQAAATQAATVAQEELNVAMELNPIAAVVAALAFLVAAIAIWKRGSTDAEVQQRKLNSALQAATGFLNADLQSLQNYTDKEAALMKQRGATATQLAKQEGDAGNKRLKILDDARVAAAKAYNESVATDKATTEAKGKLYEQLTALENQYQQERAALIVKGVDFVRTKNDDELNSFIALQAAKVAQTVAGSDAERNAQIAEIEKTQAARIQLAKEGGATEGEITKLVAEDERQVRDLQLANYQHYLKSKTALAEANLANAKAVLIKNQVDSIASINAITDAQIAAAKKQRDEAIKGDPTLNSDETKKIVAETNLQILTLEQDKQNKLLDIQKSFINAKLILAQKGSEDEYNLQLQLIEKEQSIELSATEISNAKKLEILAKYQKQREDLQKAFVTTQLQNQISGDNASLDQFGITEDNKLAITIKRINEEKQVELLAANDNLAKIAEVNAKYDKQLVDAKKASNSAILAENLRVLEAYSAQSAANNERIIANDKSTYSQRLAASNQLLDDELRRLNLEHKALTDQVEQNLLTAKEFDVAYQEISNKRTAAIIANEQRITAATLKEIDKQTAAYQNIATVLQNGLQAIFGTDAFSTALTELSNFGVKAQEIFAKIKANTISTKEGMAALISAGVAATQASINQIFADTAAARQQSLDQQITALEAQKTAELGQKNLTEQQKADIEKKYAAKEAEAKRKAFIADKDAKVAQAIINGALAVTNILATAPIVSWPFLIPIAVATTAAQVVEINSTKVPQFRKGGYTGNKGVDDEAGIVHGQEFVAHAAATKKHRGLLEAINSDKLTDYLETMLPKASVDLSTIPMPFKMYDMPSLAPLPEWVTRQHQNLQIDYDEIGKAVAKHASEKPQLIVNFDEDGHTKYWLNKGNRRQYLNRRYSFRQ